LRGLVFGGGLVFFGWGLVLQASIAMRRIAPILVFFLAATRASLAFTSAGRRTEICLRGSAPGAALSMSNCASATRTASLTVASLDLFFRVSIFSINETGRSIVSGMVAEIFFVDMVEGG